MARQLPTKKTPKHKLIIKAVFDFYGEGISNKEIRQAKEIALHIMRRKRGVILNEEQKENMWCIKQNLGDKIYTDSFVKA